MTEDSKDPTAWMAVGEPSHERMALAVSRVAVLCVEGVFYNRVLQPWSQTKSQKTQFKGPV